MNLDVNDEAPAKWRRVDQNYEITSRDPEAVVQPTNDVITTTTSGGTPLHWVAVNAEKLSDEELVAKAASLLDNGADVNATDVDGETALMLAVRRKQKILAGFLVEKGADVKKINRNGQSVFHLAVVNQDLETLKELLKNVKRSRNSILNVKDEVGRTALMDSARVGAGLDFAKILMKHGAIHGCEEVKKGKKKPTPARTTLHTAVLYGRVDYVKYLLEKKMNLDAPDGEGNTSLMLAAIANDLVIAKLLIEHQAEVKRTNNQMRTARQLAEERGNAEVVAYLKGFEQKDEHEAVNGLETQIEISQESESSLVHPAGLTQPAYDNGHPDYYLEQPTHPTQQNPTYPTQLQPSYQPLPADPTSSETYPTEQNPTYPTQLQPSYQPLPADPTSSETYPTQQNPTYPTQLQPSYQPLPADPTSSETYPTQQNPTYPTQLQPSYQPLPADPTSSETYPTQQNPTYPTQLQPSYQPLPADTSSSETYPTQQNTTYPTQLQPSYQPLPADTSSSETYPTQQNPTYATQLQPSYQPLPADPSSSSNTTLSPQIHDPYGEFFQEFHHDQFGPSHISTQSNQNAYNRLEPQTGEWFV